MGSGSSVELEKARAQDAPDDASDFTTLFDARKEIVRMRELLLDPLSDPALRAAAAAPKTRVEASVSPLQLSALTQADASFLAAKPRNVAEISVPNLKANLKIMRERCARSGLKMMLMLSADAFGCGIAMTTRLAMQAGIGIFGVSTLEDALKIRHAGVLSHDARIIVMGPVDSSEFAAFVNHEIEFLIQSISTVQRVIHWCTSKAADEGFDESSSLYCHVLLNNPANKTCGLNFAPEYRWHSIQTIKQLLTVTDPATAQKESDQTDIAAMLQKKVEGPSDAWYCPICNSENHVSRGFDRKCRVCKSVPSVQIRHDQESSTYRQGVRIELRGLCSHLHSSMINHGAVLEQYKTMAEALRSLTAEDLEVPSVHMDSSESVLAGYLDKTNIVRLLAACHDEEALVKIQQMQGVINRNLSAQDGRRLSPKAVAATSALAGVGAGGDVGFQGRGDEELRPGREVLARVASAVYGCMPPRSKKIDIQPVLTVRAQIREIYLCRQGDFVGSDKSYQAAYDCLIGVCAIGFGDGYPMGLSNEGKIVVKNHSFRVVGAVQMDYINVNLGVPESSAPGASVKIGDYATVFSSEGACSWHSMAAICEGRPSVAALMSGISSRVTRYYVTAQEAAERDAAALRAASRRNEASDNDASNSDSQSSKCRCVERLSLGYCRVHDKQRSALVANISIADNS